MKSEKFDEKNAEEYFTNMQRCTKCILPETFPGIKFDEKGVCNYCHSHEPIKVLGEKEFKKKLSQYKGKGKKYDCIIPISGGRDSAFVLHQVVKKYGMNALALTVDSGAILPEGHKNVKTITEKLGVDHVWLKDEKHIENAQKTTKLKFKGWIKNPSINTIVPVLNSADKTMNLKMYKHASENGIPLMMGGNIIGNSNFEMEHFKTGFMNVFPDDRGVYKTSDKIKLVFLFGYEFIKNPSNFRWSILKEYVDGIAVYFFESALKPKNVDSLGFYDYIYWNEKEIVSTITKELNWKGAKDATTTWRIDDTMYPLINYLYYKLVGFTESDEMYSKMVREGQMTRDEAMKRAFADHHSQWIHGPRLLGILKELDVNKEELDASLDGYRAKLLNARLKKCNKQSKK
jgi:hypothetical protein